MVTKIATLPSFLRQATFPPDLQIPFDDEIGELRSCRSSPGIYRQYMSSPNQHMASPIERCSSAPLTRSSFSPIPFNTRDFQILSIKEDPSEDVLKAQIPIGEVSAKEIGKDLHSSIIAAVEKINEAYVQRMKDTGKTDFSVLTMQWDSVRQEQLLKSLESNKLGHF